MSPLVSISAGGPLPILLSTTPTTATFSSRRFSTPFASLASSQSPPPPPQPQSKSNSSSSKTPFVVDSSSSKSSNNSFNYALANPNGSDPALKFVRSTESGIEKVIFDFRFLALLAVGGSLAGSLLCFLNGCVYIVDAYKVYWTSCSKGVHTGKMVLRLVEAIDVYLAGTVMLIFAMGLYGLFISNSPNNVPAADDRALKVLRTRDNVTVPFKPLPATKTQAPQHAKIYIASHNSISTHTSLPENMSPLLSSISGGGPFPILLSTTPATTSFSRRFSTSFASLDSPQPKSISSKTPFAVDSSSKSSDSSFNYALANPNGSDPALQFARSTESDIERERPQWMKISSLDELKTKVGHVIVMILLVKMFEKSKMVTISTGLDLLTYSLCIFLSSASLYILHNLHKDDHHK
ncbi:Uncharacterized protein family UPF0114 [Cynara cardunculus var. scolymus]|uniref:Uncharacterized protein family UPF0114 n=1 Tax=Cynara cardunculus var. scolymus TaxID=59895 RepID=A0A118K029_CYNCS|nr:Uncharacterized protein family UPF0114 [Cynara cardunculus var. scolymus]